MTGAQSVGDVRLCFSLRFAIHAASIGLVIVHQHEYHPSHPADSTGRVNDIKLVDTDI